MKKAVVIGAGFSGLTTAFYLQERGWQVEVYEKAQTSGGLLQTRETPWGFYETAANGLFNSLELERIAEKIDVPMLGPLKESRRRFIFRNNPRRWPLGVFETLYFLFKFIFASRKPRAHETIVEWGNRVLGFVATRYLLSPALQGIYAGSIDELSATLILSRFFNRKKMPQPATTGTVSPQKGVGSLIEGLENYLRKQGVVFRLTQPGALPDSQENICVIATDSTNASSLLSKNFPEAASLLSQIERLPLVTTTAFFAPTPSKAIRGFGVLFPRDQGFRAQGVLFNSFIFSGRSTQQSETWILGGALDKDVTKLPDDAITEIILSDRSKLYGVPSPTPLGIRFTRWPDALPHYTVKLERTLEQLKVEERKLERRGIFLAGNYLGRIGLSQLLVASQNLAERIDTTRNEMTRKDS